MKSECNTGTTDKLSRPKNKFQHKIKPINKGNTLKHKTES